jgi:hypothetical protein
MLKYPPISHNREYMGLVMYVVHHHEKILIHSYMVGKNMAFILSFTLHVPCSKQGLP